MAGVDQVRVRHAEAISVLVEVPRAWERAIWEFVAWMTVEGYPEATRTTRRQHMALMAKSVPAGPWMTTAQDWRAYFVGLDVAANTYRSRRTTVRAFYRWAMVAGHVTAVPTETIPRGEVPRPRPKPTPDHVLRAALAAASPRERLMIDLAKGHGLRRAEIAQVHPERDMFEDLDGWSLTVHGKGGKDRDVPLRPATASVLRAIGPGYAFKGRIDGHLSARHVGVLLARLLPGEWTGHSLRHRAATDWYEDCGDLLVVGELLGHAGPNTTALYVLPNRKRMRQVVEHAAGERQSA
jgi:integrase